MPIKMNKYIDFGEYFAIELYKPFTYTVEDLAYISKEDIEKACKVFWRKTRFGYARGFDKEKGKEIFLHKLVTGTDATVLIDHINRNKLDCRRENLRIANRSINSINRNVQANSKTGIAGVSYDKRIGKYRAYGKVYGKQIFFGYYEKKEDACTARKRFERDTMQMLLGQLHMKIPVVFDDIFESVGGVG